ncbi:hypothetical protein H0Z60_19930 [Ectothiorhodospiraceae bacterium WFHF3C12]|nr:hypothetical protein [Ectothiorhodospiraceae bacterium WFHF3C12]
MPNPDMLVLMAFPLALLVIYLYRAYQRLSEVGERRRDPAAKLMWIVALAGVLYLAWYLMQT